MTQGERVSEWNIDAANRALVEHFAPWVRALDLTIEQVGDTGATLRMRFHDDLCRSGGIVSGQALSALADTSMVFAIASASGGMRAMATIDLHTTFMRAAVDADVFAHAQVERLGRTLAFARVTMRAGEAIVATAVGTFALP